MQKASTGTGARTAARNSPRPLMATHRSSLSVRGRARRRRKRAAPILLEPLPRAIVAR